MRVVIALGGNALLKRDEPPEAEIQRRNIGRAATDTCRHCNQHIHGGVIGLVVAEHHFRQRVAHEDHGQPRALEPARHRRVIAGQAREPLPL